MSILHAQHLAKSFKTRTVVNDVSIEVKSGEVVGLLGPNGAGKTTSFYMMVGLIATDAGRIYLNDEDITDLPVHARARKGIGYLPQEASVFRKLSVEDNIQAILEHNPALDRNAREHLLESLLEDFQIQHIRESTGMSLSGVSGGASRLPALWPRNPISSCSTNPLPGLTRFRSLRYRKLSGI